MYTPARNVRRRLFATPASASRAPKRARTATSRARAVNRFITRGVRRTGTLTQQVKSLQSFVNKLKPEKKYVDVGLTLTNIADAGTGGVVHLTQVAQGDTQSTRTGNAINLTDIKIGFQFDRGTTVSAGNNGHVRFAVVVDKEQVADTSPTAAAIFTSGDPICPRPNLANLERFRILYISPQIDPLMAVLDTDITSPPQRSNLMEYSWSGNLKVAFNDTASTDIEKNGVYFVVLSANNSDTIDTSGTCRIGFTDV